MTTEAVMPPTSPVRNAGTARTEIAVFLTTTAALLAVSTTVAAAEGVDVRRIEDASALGQTAMYVQALFPLVGAIVARLATAGTLRRPGWGFRRTPLRVLGLAWAYALGTTLAGGALVWATGVGGFDSDTLDPSILLGLTVLVLPYVVLALGEDIGWRGLLVPRLAELTSPRGVILLSGLAWSAFHWPLIAFLGGTPEGVSVWYALLMFTIGTTALGAVLASMQLTWGIWPGVVAHAVVNATMYHVLEPLTEELEHTTWFATETGLFVAVVGVVGAALWLRRFPIRSRR